MNRANLVGGFLIVMALRLIWTESAAAQGGANAPQPSLVIAVSITSQRYCANGPDMMTLQMRLHLRYLNAGNQKLILYKGDDLFYQAKIRALRAADNAKPYEIAVLNARYLEIENEPVEQPAPGKLFVILQPGSSYETETTVGIGVVGESARRARHAILEVEHTLQLIVSTWYRSQAVAEKLRREWQRKGFLWSRTVASNELTFKAERPPSPSICK
jgi:hypothetical protein